ncbi:MAG: hypothetical protein HGB09_05685 [Chlorobiaceae bacterium]|nr:hypothetical protein [Chlorobiaceae bacterium]
MSNERKVYCNKKEFVVTNRIKIIASLLPFNVFVAFCATDEFIYSIQVILIVVFQVLYLFRTVGFMRQEVTVQRSIWLKGFVYDRFFIKPDHPEQKNEENHQTGCRNCNTLIVEKSD